jgi:hypothetical protein
MATSTYTPLATYTMPSAAVSYTFNSISANYTDLVIVINGNTSYNTSADAYQLSFNGATTGLSATRLGANGSSSYSDRYGTPYAGWMSTTIGADTIHIMNYSNTNIYKTALTKSASQGSYPQIGATVTLWQSTNAITSVTISDTSGNWQIGTTFSLYGIKAEVGGTGSKATGGTVYTDATYAYHVFTTSGNFVPTTSISADILVVAGGGGAAYGGGAGAGGYSTFTSQSLTAQNYSCLIGAGGGAGVTNSVGGQYGSKGTDTTFGASISVTGGGAGGGLNAGSITNGGSGGGLWPNPSTSTGGTGVAGQGNNAGTTSKSAPNYTGGGGGGAGAVGGNGSGTTAGDGGVGSSNAISGGATTGAGQLVSGTYYFAGGGGGGTYNGGTAGNGGNGGGGAGSASSTGTSGVTNTGGGGGGGSQYSSYFAGGNGGSGIVIVRYAK